MMLERSWPIMLLVVLLGCSNARAEPHEDDLSVPERAYLVSKIYASIQTYFAHWAGIPDLDFDAAYKSYLNQALEAKGRREFDLATLQFIAQLRNKHTQFQDQWLQQRHGQPLGFGVGSVEGKWVITWTRDPRLSKGDVVRAIDGMDIEAFLRDKQRYIAASNERSAQSLVFDRPYLLPQRFTLDLEGDRRVSVDREATRKLPTQEAGPPAAEGRWLVEGSIGYLRIPGFNDPNFEKSALAFVRNHSKAKCLIIDVRGNGGGSTPYELIRELMDRPWRDWTTFTPSLVALYRAQGKPPAPLRIESRSYLPRPEAFAGRLLLLIDRFSCSACEDFIMALKDNGRATLLGEKTEGSSGQPYFLNLGNGLSLLVGAARYSFPDGSPFEGQGIKPTIPVELRLTDLRAGIDLVLQKARELAEAP
jgi:carboxyl-terminal processing protease